MFQSIPREKILGVIAKLGPVQPLDVRRDLGEGDTVLIGAILSEMASNGHILITRMKRGGSPFYYSPKDVSALEKISQYLGEKDRKTYDILRDRKTLSESGVDPLTRVSLQNIPDFARRFIVQVEGQDVAYWRYFLVPEEDAVALVLEKHKPRKAPPPEPEPEAEIQQELAPRPVKKHRVRMEDWMEEDKLWHKLHGFGDRESASLSEPECIKPGQEISALMTMKGSYGSETYHVFAVSRKTLPEQLVWKQLLKARANGLPLLVLKDSAFPKSLPKKFDDVPNVYFKRL